MIKTAALAVLFWVTGVVYPETEVPSQVDEPARSLPSINAAVEKGLAWLANQQNRGTGSFGGSRYPVATTSMACLALMASGSTPSRGRFADTIQRGIRYLLRLQNKRTGYFECPMGSRMHGHGYATLFLAEAYGMAEWENEVERAELRESLKRAIKLIEGSQSNNGGWGYAPGTHGVQYQSDENSVIPAQVAALRSARNAGIQVDIKTINKAVDYVYRCIDPQDGLLQYHLGAGQKSTALTAVGLSVMGWLGVVQEDKDGRVLKGVDYLMKHMPVMGGSGGQSRGMATGHSMYAVYYATLVMYQKGGDYWKKWHPSVVDYLVKSQSANGSWSDQNTNIGLDPTLATAFSLQALQVTNEYLPIFQR